VSFQRHRAEDPLADIGQKLSDAIKQKNELPKESKETSPPELEEGSKDSLPPMRDNLSSEPTEEGSRAPNLNLPSVPTIPAMEEPPAFPPSQEASQPTIQEMAEDLGDLKQSIKELVDGLKETIVTSAPPGQANLSANPQKEGLNEGNLDFGLEPTNQHPFTRPIAHHRGVPQVTSQVILESPQRRPSMLQKHKMAARKAFPVRRRAEDGVTETPPESLESLIEEPTPKVEGEKPFVMSPPKLTTEKEVEDAISQSKKEEGLPELLYPQASELRAARKARLGLDFQGYTKLSQEGKSTIFGAAERKASDMAALRVARYYKATELAHQAQERGIVDFPLHTLLSARLATLGVPDAELVAADVLEGASDASFKAAHEAALKYLSMDDSSFLNVQATIASTPTLNARGGYMTDRTRKAQTVRQEASLGSLHLQASGPTGIDSLREVLRRGTPRPPSLSR
jgi:hypothetical protein